MSADHIDLKKIRPYGDRVLISLQKEEQTEGGILLANDAREKQKSTYRAQVLAVGPGAIDQRTGERIPMPALQVGQMILTRNMGPVMMASCRPSTDISNPDAETTLAIPADWILAILDTPSA